MTKSNLFLSGMAILLIVFCLMFVHAAVVQRKADPVLKKKAEMVEDLEITWPDGVKESVAVPGVDRLLTVTRQEP